MYAISTSKDHDEYLKKKVKTFRKSKFLTDFQIIGYNGSVSLHKIILLPKLPQLLKLLCDSCDFHSITALILPEVSKDEIEKEVKELYIDGNVKGLQQLLGFERQNFDSNPSEIPDACSVSTNSTHSITEITENHLKEDTEDNKNDKQNELKEAFRITPDIFPVKIDSDGDSNRIIGADVANVIKISSFSFFNYNCHLCDSQFTSDSELSNHFYATHAPVCVEGGEGDTKPRYQCRACSKQFTKFPAAVKHCRVRGPAYSCPDCSITISNSNNVSRHKKRCKGQKSFFCSKCQRIIKARMMESHGNDCQGKRRRAKVMKVKREDEASLACSLCDFTSGLGSSLKKHITLTHNEGRNKLNCEKCNRDFYSASGLRKHKADLHSQINFEEIRVA